MATNQTAAKGEPTTRACGADKKYEFTDARKLIDGHVLHQIRALRDFYTLSAYTGMHTEELCLEPLPMLIRKGTLGGWIESYDNLENFVAGDCSCWVAGDSCWVANNACVYAGSKVTGTGLVCHSAKVYNGAEVSDHGVVGGYANVFGRVKVEQHGTIGGHAVVCNRKTVKKTVVSEFASVSGFARIQVGNIAGCARVDGCASLLGKDDIYLNGYVHVTGRSTLRSDGGAIRATDGVYIGGHAYVGGDSSLCGNTRLM